MRRMAEDKTPNYFGVALKYILKNEKPGAQRELAEKLKISVAQIQRIQSGVSSGSVATRNAIAKELGTTHEDMIALGRKLIDQGGSESTGEMRYHKVCLSPKAVAWWPEIDRYIEMINLAAESNNAELYFHVVEALIKQAIVVLRENRARFAAEKQGRVKKAIEGGTGGDDVESGSFDIDAKGFG
jgi:transcriptional regulator with XRE-family HTH domain